MAKLKHARYGVLDLKRDEVGQSSEGDAQRRPEAEAGVGVRGHGFRCCLPHPTGLRPATLPTRAHKGEG
jgi:hypothetical protein